MYTHEFTAAPLGYQTKKGAVWVKKEEIQSDCTTRNKVDPLQAPINLVPMPQDGVIHKRQECDNLFAQGWDDLTKDEEVKPDMAMVGRCGDMSSIMGIHAEQERAPLSRAQLSPTKKLVLRDLGWCKPFLIEDDLMTDERLNAELEKAGHTCHLRYRHFRTCMRKLDYDHSGEVDLLEFTTFFNTEFGVPVKTATAIFNMLNTQGQPENQDGTTGRPELEEPVLDYNELMVVLGPYIAPGAPPPVQMKAGNRSTGSVHGLHLRKLG